MTFDEFLTYCAIKGATSKTKLIDVNPFGVQYRVRIEVNGCIGTIFYREINGTRILVKNSIRLNSKNALKLKHDLTTNELVEMFS